MFTDYRVDINGDEKVRKYHCFCDTCGKDKGYMRKRQVNKPCKSCANRVRKPDKLEKFKLVWSDKMDHAEHSIPHNIDIDYIQKTVSNYFNISQEQLYTRKRKQSEIEPRQISMYISREQTKNSLAVIGLRHGGFDHATSLSNHRRIAGLRDTDSRIRQYIEEIEKKLK